MRVGIDVGGTNTDAVLVDGQEVVGKIKTATTADVTSGVVEALRELTAGDRPPPIDAVMIGTTHFTNAVVERRGLEPVAALRLAAPATLCLPPMLDWPQDLHSAVDGFARILQGGQEFDGRPIAPVSTDELDEVADELRRRRITAAAITSVFSPVDPSAEVRVAEHLTQRVPDLDVTCSHEIGKIGLLERENAAILNAGLRSLARRTIAEFRAAIAKLRIAAPVYLTQNDGTLMSADLAERYPVLTFSSGPTNSMRGAGFLTGLDEALVVDVGGTTTDVGALTRGFPRQASLDVEIGGVRTNFRMPDVHAVGLGGGTVVRGDPRSPHLGPDSVGYRLLERARVFGGDTLTATDVVVAAGAADLGDRSRVSDLDPDHVQRIRDLMRRTIDEAVDRVRLSREPLPVIVVGGGRILVTDRVEGASQLVVPEHYEAANAIGAAIAQVSGEEERVVDLTSTTREEAMAGVRAQATRNAIAAGADPSTIEVLDAEDVPLAYLPGNASRVRVKVVGELQELSGREEAAPCGR